MRTARFNWLTTMLMLTALAHGVAQASTTSTATATATATTTTTDSDVTVSRSEIIYRTHTGDTLTSIAQRFTGSAANWAALANENGIRVDTRISVNTAIRIPADLLTDEPVSARVIALSGTVTASGADKVRIPLQPGSNVAEGTLLATSKNSFVTLELSDASRVSIPSNTVVQMTKLRTTHYTHSPRTAITIFNGSIESVVSPLKPSKGRYQIFSPSATAGVRGTHFRVTVLPNGRSANALFDGVIELEQRTSTAHATLNAGFGNVIDQRKIGPAVPLLGAPQLHQVPVWQDNAEARFQVTPQPGAKAYHLQLAVDAEARFPIIEARSASPAIALQHVAEGDYSIRLSAIDANGIEGASRVVPISLRHTASPTATIDAPSAPYLGGADEQRLNLKWLDKTGTKFRLQVARDIDFSWLQYNTSAAGSEISLPRPPFGTYYARVQRQNSDGSLGPFSAIQAFVVTDQWTIVDGPPRPIRALAPR